MTKELINRHRNLLIVQEYNLYLVKYKQFIDLLYVFFMQALQMVSHTKNRNIFIPEKKIQLPACFVCL